MVASAPILVTRAGLLVYISYLPVRSRLIERLNEGLSAYNKHEELTKISRLMEDSPYGEDNIATSHSRQFRRMYRT